MAEQYNPLGEHLQRRERHWSADEMVQVARRQTGLNDLGSDHFRPGLEVLLEAYCREGGLSWLGQVATKQRILLALRTRLLVANELATHPEALNTCLPRPIIIASLPRTGTTFLHRLLALDSAGRALATWEAIMPARRRQDVARGTDTRRSSMWALRVLAAGIQTIAPHYRAMHSVEIDSPEEELALLENSFVSDFIALPTYRRWYLEHAPSLLAESYRDLANQLRLISWLRPPTARWILKTPSHLYGLDHLLHEFDDASLIQVHREPLEVLASMVQMSRAVRKAFAPSRVVAAEDDCLQWMIGALKRSLEVRSRTNISVLDVRFRSLVTEPVSVVRTIYANLELPYSAQIEARIAIAAERSRPSRMGGGGSRTEPSPGFLTAEALMVFAEYRKRFGLIHPIGPQGH